MFPKKAESVRDHIKNLVIIGSPVDKEGAHVELSRQQGLITGTLNRLLGGDANRRLSLAWLFGSPLAEISSHTLTSDQWWALWEWGDFKKEPDTGEWLLSPAFPNECAAVLTAAIQRVKSLPLGQRPLDFDGLDMLAVAVGDVSGEVTEVSEPGKTLTRPIPERPMSASQVEAMLAAEQEPISPEPEAPPMLAEPEIEPEIEEMPEYEYDQDLHKRFQF